VFDQPVGPVGKPAAHYIGVMNWRIVPVELPLFLHHLRTILLQMLHEPAQGLQDEGGVDGGAPGHDIPEDEAL